MQDADAAQQQPNKKVTPRLSATDVYLQFVILLKPENLLLSVRLMACCFCVETDSARAGHRQRKASLEA